MNKKELVDAIHLIGADAIRQWREDHERQDEPCATVAR
jgi:hypothetical protein